MLRCYQKKTTKMKCHFRSIKFKVIIITIMSVIIYLLMISDQNMENPLDAKQKLSLNYVVVHLDLKGAPPKLTYLESLLPYLAKLGVNALLIEYEDMFPYDKSLIRLRAKNCYEKIQLKNFLTQAVKSGFEIIPLIQTFGHMEFVLKLDEFKHLREHKENSDSICPSKKQSLELIEEMLRQVIDFHRSISPLKHIHIGCDEVHSLKECSYCQRRPESVNQIFIKHVAAVEDIVDRLSQRTTVLIWDDMLRTIKNGWKTMKRFNNIEPVYWSYESNVRVSHFALYQYHKWFRNIWIASAFKGADGNTAILPMTINRFMNHLTWMNNILGYTFGGHSEPFEFKGIILTGWSRFSHFDTLCELLPTSIPSLILNLVAINKYKEGIIPTNQFDDWDKMYTYYVAPEYSKAMNCSHNKIVKLSDYINMSSCNFTGNFLYDSAKRLELDFINISDCLNLLLQLQSSGNITSIANTCGKSWNESINKDIIKHINKVAMYMSQFYDDIVIEDYFTSKTKIAKQMLDALYPFLKDGSVSRSMVTVL